jgi:hypothetical protein
MFSLQFSFHRLLHTHQHLSSGAGTIDQTVADVPSGLSLTSPKETNKNRTKLVMGVCALDLSGSSVSDG